MSSQPRPPEAAPLPGPTTWRRKIQLLEDGPLVIADAAAELCRQIQGWCPVTGKSAALSDVPSLRDAAFNNVYNAHRKLALLLDPEGRLREPAKPAKVGQLAQEALGCRYARDTKPLPPRVLEQVAWEARRRAAPRLAVEDVTGARTEKLIHRQLLIDALEAVQLQQLAVADHYRWRDALYSGASPRHWKGSPPPISHDLVVRLSDAAGLVREVAGGWAEELRRMLPPVRRQAAADGADGQDAYAYAQDAQGGGCLTWPGGAADGLRLTGDMEAALVREMAQAARRPLDALLGTLVTDAPAYYVLQNRLNKKLLACAAPFHFRVRYGTVEVVPGIYQPRRSSLTDARRDARK
jgi:hypothetical protein